MSNEEFDELSQNIGGLIAFNSFLSTSSDKDVSLGFARPALDDCNLKAILYVINADPTLLASTPVAHLGENHSCFSDEKEYLWGMNAIFRIGTIVEVENGLWQVNLTVTTDDDSDLRRLTEYMRREAGVLSGMQRLGNVMIDMGEWSKAKDIYETLRHKEENTSIDSQLAYIAYHMNDLDAALKHYQHVLAVLSNDPSQNAHKLSTLYQNIGCIFISKNLPKPARKSFQHALDLERTVANPIKENIVSNHYELICILLRCFF